MDSRHNRSGHHVTTQGTRKAVRTAPFRKRLLARGDGASPSYCLLPSKETLNTPKYSPPKSVSKGKTTLQHLGTSRPDPRAPDRKLYTRPVAASTMRGAGTVLTHTIPVIEITWSTSYKTSRIMPLPFSWGHSDTPTVSSRRR